MDYVYRLLGIRTKYEEDAITSVPNFIYARYSLKNPNYNHKEVIIPNIYDEYCQ